MTLIKGILLSIRAEYLVRILNGEKTSELRKSIPKGFVGWVYLYCAKAKPRLFRLPNSYTESGEEWYIETDLPWGWSIEPESHFNGRVVARFWFDEYDILFYHFDIDGNKYLATRMDDKKIYWELDENNYLNRLCLTYEDIVNYGNYKTLYAWHIKQLGIFDKPKELKDFYVFRKKKVDIPLDDIFDVRWLNKLIDWSWQYVYTEEQE